MIIGVDGNEANIERKVGISEFAYKLITEFYKRTDIGFEVYLKDEPRFDMPKVRDGWSYKIVGPKKFWTQFGLPKALFFNSPKPDLFFSPTHYGPRFSPIPTVVSIMDLAFIHYPETFKKKDLYKLNNWTAYSVRKAKKVIAISNSTKDDIINKYKVSSGKVEVVYPGIKELSTSSQILRMEELEKKYKINGKYILFVSTLQPRKNIERLIEAFKLVLQKQKDINLVIIGKKGWLYDEILQAPKKFEIEGNVHFLDFVSDEDLPSFYKNAQCFVMPSLYEGFGLPILEAMQYRCPVITSNISSLPEVGGDAAEYFDPYKVDDIAKKIEKVLTSEIVRDTMIKKGYEQVKKFNWEKSASKVLEVLQDVVENKKYE